MAGLVGSDDTVGLGLIALGYWAGFVDLTVLYAGKTEMRNDTRRVLFLVR